MAYIYTLEEDNKVIYVGRTKEPISRLNNHRRIRKGRSINMSILEECDDDAEREREFYWMKIYLEKGCKLENKGQYGKYSAKDKYHIPKRILDLMTKNKKYKPRKQK